MEERRTHILEEYTKLKKLEVQRAKIFVVGTDFIGVEWGMELKYFAIQMKLTIIAQVLGPLPDTPADYGSGCMHA